jgi:hypothetical protein
MITSRLTACLLGGAGLALLAAAPALAQDVEQTYKQYQAGIFAKELCTGNMFGQDEFNKLGAALDKKVKDAIGAGRRLMLIEEMKGSTRTLVQNKGCDSADVQSLLKLYDELESGAG